MRFLSALVALLLAAPAFAASYAIGQQGAAAEGVAGAATARDDLPEVGWFNPAAQPSGVVLGIGGTVIFPRVEHTAADAVNTTTETPPATPPWAHLGYVFRHDRQRFGLFVTGHVPFGAGLQWPENWPGRYEVTAVNLRIYEAAANAVYGISWAEDIELGVAAQFRLLRGTFELGRRIDTVSDEATVALGGAGNASAYGASAFGRFGGLTAGVNFRSGVSLPIDGSAHFEDVPVELSGAAHDQRFTTAFELPARLALGAAYDLGFGTPSVDVELFDWSRIDTFAIDFADAETPDVSQPRDYHNTVAVRVGYEHRLLDGRLAVRGGFAYDPAPTPATALSPSSPDVSRLIGSLGAGFEIGRGLRVDAAFSHMALLKTRAVGDELFPGTYSGAAEIVSLGLAWSAPEF